MTTDPATLRNRSLLLSTRCLLVTSVRHRRDVRFEVAATRHGRDSGDVLNAFAM